MSKNIYFIGDTSLNDIKKLVSDKANLNHISLLNNDAISKIRKNDFVIISKDKQAKFNVIGVLALSDKNLLDKNLIIFAPDNKIIESIEPQLKRYPNITLVESYQALVQEVKDRIPAINKVNDKIEDIKESLRNEVAIGLPNKNPKKIEEVKDSSKEAPPKDSSKEEPPEEATNVREKFQLKPRPKPRKKPEPRPKPKSDKPFLPKSLYNEDLISPSDNEYLQTGVTESKKFSSPRNSGTNNFPEVKNLLTESNSENPLLESLEIKTKGKKAYLEVKASKKSAKFELGDKESQHIKSPLKKILLEVAKNIDFKTKESLLKQSGFDVQGAPSNNIFAEMLSDKLYNNLRQNLGLDNSLSK